MGENQYSVSVKPITLQAGESRWLAASFSDPAEVDQITHAILVDDFRATGSTIDGVKQNIVMPMFPQLEHFEAMAALGKPSQEKIRGSKVETALDVSFWADRERNIALLQVNNGPIYKMHKASVEDFV
jgi:hypothetical protein